MSLLFDDKLCNLIKDIVIYVALSKLYDDTHMNKISPFRNFRASKAKGQEIGKLPSTEERIDCFSISFQPLRVELEIMNRRYWDILVQSLHNAIIKDINTIEKFTEDAIEVSNFGEPNLLELVRLLHRFYVIFQTEKSEISN